MMIILLNYKYVSLICLNYLVEGYIYFNITININKSYYYKY